MANLAIEPPPARRDTNIGIAMRVAFFVGAAYVCASVFENAAALLVHSLFLGSIIGVYATGLVANAVTMRIFDRRPLADIGLAGATGTGRNFALGVLLGSVAGALLLGIPLLAGGAHFEPRSGADFSWFSVALYLVVLVFGAAGEETIFRGYAFQLLVEKVGAFATIIPCGLLFGLAHSANPNATRMGVVNTALWGILLGCAFLRSRDLWLPIGMHYGWNAVLPFFGTNLSGITIEVTRYSYRWNLGPLWSGGDYGPEGGLLTTLITLLLFFVLWKTPVLPQHAAIAVSLNEPPL